MKQDSVIVGLDIGTSKVACLVAESRGSSLDIIGVGTAESRGLKKGVVVDIGAVIECLDKAVQDAETMCGRTIESACVSITGSHVTGEMIEGMIVIQGPEVTPADISRVIEAAQSGHSVPPDRTILHIEPLEFIVDNQRGIREPIGMAGKRLIARVHRITANSASVQNIARACNSVGVDVQATIPQPLASATSVLQPHERDLGVALVDIGGGTTDIAVYAEGALRHVHVINVAGAHFTNDLLIGLRTTPVAAKKLKEISGIAFRELLTQDEEIEVPNAGGQGHRKALRSDLLHILGPRAQELMMLVRSNLEDTGWISRIPGGIVITGGGAELTGIIELAQSMFDMPVRKGSPEGVGGLVDIVSHPAYATSIGLLLYAQAHPESGYGTAQSNQLGQTLDNIKKWFANLFN